VAVVTQLYYQVYITYQTFSSNSRIYGRSLDWHYQLQEASSVPHPTGYEPTRHVHYIVIDKQGNTFFFDILLTVHLSMFISVINQLDAQNFCFTIILFHASTCFEHMCSPSGGQNCIKQPLVSRPPDDEHMCSKHVEAWNKLIVKQKFCASSWLINEIRITHVICTILYHLQTRPSTLCERDLVLLPKLIQIIVLCYIISI